MASFGNRSQGCRAAGRRLGGVITVCLLGLIGGFGNVACGSSDSGSVSERHAGAPSQPRPSAITTPRTETVTLDWEIVAEYPHDGCAFTQGLLWTGERLFESTGRYRQSSVRQVAIDTGEVLKRTDLSASLFGEGLAMVGERLIQLTWHAGKALIWNSEDLSFVGEIEYRGEGWGLTYDPTGERLVMSNGSDQLVFRDPDSFDVISTLDVTSNGVPLGSLNELEWIDGRVWANVLSDDRLFRIDPESGEVDAVADLSALRSRFAAEAADGLDRSCRPNVLNGIAYRQESETFLVTGKYWPRLFEIRWREEPER